MHFPFTQHHVKSYQFIESPVTAIAEAIRGSIGALGWTLEDDDDGVLIATIPISLRSWGERIRIQIEPSGAVVMTSTCIDPISIWDMGKNRANVELLLAGIQTYLGVITKNVDPTMAPKELPAAKFDYPYVRVHGRDAIRTLVELRARGGCVPVILGSPAEFSGVKETMELNDTHSVEELIELSRTIDAESWFREHEEPEVVSNREGAVEWPSQGDIPTTELMAHLDLRSGLPLDEIIIAEIPAAMSWRVPCYLRIGSWNGTPSAEVHAAIFKYWGDRFHATVACITHDTIEFTVDRPPSTREAALALARQHYAYCPDVLGQGTGAVESLAALLLNSKVWFFWWD